MEFEEEDKMARAKPKEWFCGSNTSGWTFHNSYSYGRFLQDICLVNFYYSVFHVAFAILLISTQGIAYCQIKQQRRFLLKLPGHNIRWMFVTLLVFIQIVATAEGILTDSTRTKEDVLSFLYLYVPSICALFAGVCAILQSHYMEVWQNKWLSIVLTTYWTLSCGTEIVRFANLQAIDMASFGIVRFDIVIILSFIYGTLDIIEINCIRTRNYSSGRSHSSVTRDKDESKQNMLFYRDYVSFPSSILHWWIHWLLRLGYRKPLTLEDLGCLPEAHLASPNYQRLKVALQEEQNIAARTGSKPSLLKVFWKLSWRVMLPYGLLRCFGEPFVLITPFAISGIITYVNALDAPPNLEETFHFITLREFFTNGFVLVVAIFAANIIERICLWTSQYMLVVESVHIRAAIQAAVYEKSLHLSSLSASKSQTSIGKITNCMSTDAGNVLMAMQMIHFVIIPPLTLATLLLLFNTLGISSVYGLAVCIVLFPVIVITSKQISIFQKKALVFADERVKHTHELLKEMKLLKLNAWEELFCQTIEKLRLKEVRHICHKNLVFAVAAFCSNATPILMTLVSFGTYTLLNEEPLTPEIAFPSLALFSLFDRFLFIIPVGLSSFVTGYVSTKRLESFLLTPCGTDVVSDDDITSTATMPSGNKEENCSHLFTNSTNHFTPKAGSDVELKHVETVKSTLRNSTLPDCSEQSVPNDIDIQLMNCNLAWDRTDTEPVLKDVDIQIESGKLTMIVGPVGSGKSALLASILEEMFLLSGDIKFPRLKPSMAFAAQRPWIQNASLRDNILCGLPMDKHRYDDVISACALEPDIDLLPAGDLTEIGERGINLSGGQKQRVNVARAIYSQAHTVLLDDPLSALDVYVGSLLFESGIVGLLRRNNRTVVLVTNQLQYLQHADKIIVLDGGVIRHQGSYSKIVEQDQQLLTQWSEAVKHTNSLTHHNTSEMERVVLQQEVALQCQYQQHSNQTKTGERSALIEKEDMMRGSVIASVYYYLIQASGWALVAFVIGFGVVQAFYLGKDFWLAKWSEAGVINPNETADQMGYFIGGYAGISLATIVVIVTSQLVYTLAALTAGITLHKAMLNNVSKLPLRFFDTNPLGRVLNRFSSDMNMIDMKLFRTIDGSTYAVWKIIFCYIAIIIVAPLFSIVAVIVGIVYFFLQRFYLKTSRELQRLESVAKSPIYAHFSETLDGLSTIKAFRFQKRFFDTLLQHIDTHSTTYLYLRTTSVWLNLRLDMMGAAVVLLAGLSTMVGAVSSSLSPALVALAIVYAQRGSASYGYLVKFLSDLEMHMNAVERVKHYATLPTEDYGGFRKPPVDWPKHGVIQFKDVSIKYANDLDPVLKRINLHFRSAEKVGICGRTGSGKSSLVLALFRCNIISRGDIYIDDINIAELPLTTLRRQLAIIPQDPTLFTGTIRLNLDPEGNKSDEELWNALTISQLKSAVTELKGGLDASVSEGGKNFSVGQRQLFCLARAFLHKSRILVMDEATASVDSETAKVLQEMLTSAFVDRTVLTIAHRVNSILESDRILVMNEGSVVEFDTPDNLLADKDSMFASIVLASEGGTLVH